MLGQFALCLVNLPSKTYVLKTKGLSIGRFYQLFDLVHRLSVVEVISVIGLINFCCVLAWSFCLQKHMFLKTKRPSIGCFFLCISQVTMSQELSISFFFFFFLYCAWPLCLRNVCFEDKRTKY